MQSNIAFREILIWPLKLIGLDENPPGKPWEKHSLALPEHSPENNIRYAEFVYFHPFVQRFLYDDSKDSPMKIFQRADIKGVRVRLSKDAPSLTLQVERVELYLFPNETVAIMAIEVAKENMTLADVQDFQDRFRRVYPPFWNDDGTAGLCPAEAQWLDKEGKDIGPSANYSKLKTHYTFARDNMAPPVSAHFAWLLEPWKPYTSARNDAQTYYRQIEDERVPFMSHIAFDNPETLTEGDLVRLAFADGGDDSSTLPYSSTFLGNFDSKYCYDRFWDPSTWTTGKPYEGKITRTMCCGYAFVCVGHKKDWFFYNLISKHFRHHYFLMGLVAHFHRAALLSFSDDISETVKSLKAISPSSKFRERIWKIYQRFLRFTNMFWFREISNQMQPRELFNLWSGHLETERSHKELVEEIKNVSEYLDSYYERRIGWLVVILTLVTVVGLIMGVLPEDWKGGLLVMITFVVFLFGYFFLRIKRMKRFINKQIIEPLMED